MIEGLPRREFSFPRFIEDFGILGVLWRKFLLYLLSGLCQGSRVSELSDVRVVFSLYSVKSGHVPLLSINPGSKFGVVLFYHSEIL